jgi:glucose-6-phosphate isomerase
MTLQKEDYPISVEFDFEKGEFAPFQSKAERKVSDLAMMFADSEAAAALVKNGDPLVYEIFYYGFKTSVSDIALGVTRIQPGTIGGEYHMTKGHFHEAHDQPEIYFCVKGEGYLLMETREGEFRADKWIKGTISHIPPMWAHRVVNIGSEPLVFVASYHLAAGHIYEPVVEKGFAKRVIDESGKPVFKENLQRR